MNSNKPPWILLISRKNYRIYLKFLKANLELLQGASLSKKSPLNNSQPRAQSSAASCYLS